MLISFEVLPEIFFYFVISFVFFWVLYRQYIFSIADPLFIFVFTTAFSSVLVVETVEDFRNICHFFMCQLFAWIGFVIVQERSGNPAIYNPQSKIHFKDLNLLRYTNYLLFTIYFISNLIIFRTKGFALLTDSPSEAKVANFQEGFGIFRKINWAIGGVSSSGLLFIYLLKKQRIDIFLLIIIMAFTALEGSKSALLRYVMTAVLFLYHPFFKSKSRFNIDIKKYAPLGLMAVFGVFFTVLLRENEDTDAIVIAFVRRLLYGADGTLFFYKPVNTDYFSRYSWFDFPLYIINPILGFLRLAPYQEAFGNVMVQNTLLPGTNMDVIVGPNTSFYIEGQIFFGFFGAFIYSFILGCTASYVRTVYFSLVRSSAFVLVFLNIIYQFATLILVDFKLFITQASDTFILVLPCYMIICFTINRKIVFRRLYFSLPFHRPRHLKKS